MILSDVSQKTNRSRRRRGAARRRNKGVKVAAAQAVRPGQVGGQYRPLSDADIERIYQTALDVLENIGIGDPIPEILEYVLPKGCCLDEDGRLRFPRSLVEDLIALSPQSYPLYAPNPDNDLMIRGEEVLFCTSGEAVCILDYESQHYRPTKLVDLYDAARNGDQLVHIHNFGQPFIAAEYSHDVYVHDMNIAYAQLAGTDKSFALGISVADHIDPLIELFDTYLGEDGAFVKRPFCTFGGCPIVSPLRFGQDGAEVLVKVAELGLVADIAVAPQAGATAPAALAGALVQCFAETLACLCVVNMVRPGTPINFGMWPFISDLRTAALSGANLIAAYPGVVGSLVAQSFEGMVIDNDLIGNVQRVLRGIEVTDETLSYDVIKDTVYGQGHFLGSQQTLELMNSEYLYPEIADRRTPGELGETGRKTLYEQAHERVGEMLADHYPGYIDPDADKRIRDRFPIRLKPEDMQPGNGRW